MPDAIDTFTVADTKHTSLHRTKVMLVTTRHIAKRKNYLKYGKEVKLKAEHYAGYTQEELDAFDLTTLADYKVTIENGLSADGIHTKHYTVTVDVVSLSSKPIQWNWYMTVGTILKQSLQKTCQNNSILVMIN